MEPKYPSGHPDTGNWSPESGDSPERERRAGDELAFEEQRGRSACDQPDEEKAAEPKAPPEGS